MCSQKVRADILIKCYDWAIEKRGKVNCIISGCHSQIEKDVFHGRYDSTRFYFNDNVEIEVEKTREGLKITRFETRILDKQGDSVKGLDGLAILLVDVDYDGVIFDTDRPYLPKTLAKMAMLSWPV